MDISYASPINEVAPVPERHLLADGSTSFFKQYQHEQFSPSPRSGSNILNFISLSGDVVPAPQAVLLRHSSYLRTLIDSSKSCGCVQDVPTLLLPDWDHQTIQALVNLCSSESAVFTNDDARVMNQLNMLMRELRFEDPLVLSSSDQNEPERCADSEVLSQAPTNQTSSSHEDNQIEETEEISQEQEEVIVKLSYVLNFLQRVKIGNEQSLRKIHKPVEDILSSLKYIPIEKSWDILPIEIKTKILSYLCDFGILTAATVCQEWRDILKPRLTSLKKLWPEYDGKICSNVYSCEEDKCFMPEEILKALRILGLDVPVLICPPISQRQAKEITECFTRVPGLNITDNKDEAENKMEQLFDQLKSHSHVVFSNYIGLGHVNMTNPHQKELIPYLLQLKEFCLRQYTSYRSPGIDEPQLDAGKFIEKILEDSNENKLEVLYLGGNIQYPENLSKNLADALCQIQKIVIEFPFPLTLASIKGMIDNILTRPIKMKKLFLKKIEVDWRDLINPENLKILLSKLENVILRGRFTTDQMEAAKLLPDVVVTEAKYENDGVISKGVDRSLYHFN